ncbi:MAG TPA: hypothetical protein VMA72_16795 [Streptosporangiaceae bacterium]|nr:hypothetical protein [Streptosporangiaceae bacterium]
MPASFDGAVALIRGSTSGMGKATAASLGRHGAHVLIVGRDVSRGQAVEAALGVSA